MLTEQHELAVKDGVSIASYRADNPKKYTKNNLIAIGLASFLGGVATPFVAFFGYVYLSPDVVEDVSEASEASDEKQNAANDEVPKDKVSESDIKELQAKAEKGDADAQIELGSMYYAGNGVAQDYKQAMVWWQKAAEQGNTYAQYNLGLMYDNGTGVAKDNVQAVSWYRKAAEQGYANAQNNLGNMYHEGEGVTQDYKQAVYWYQKAAEQGYAYAQYNLALKYEDGKGVSQDYKQAVYWYQKAAEQGNASGHNNLGVLYSEGKGVKKNKQLAYIHFEISLKIDESNKLAKENSKLAKNNLSKAQIEQADSIVKEWKVGDEFPEKILFNKPK